MLLTFLCVESRAQELASFVDSPLEQTMGEGDKAALLMVHFGTTFDETRSRTIDAINEKARKAFPNLEVRECYTSRIILRRLAKKGIRKDTPIEAMMQLRADGYTHLIVQSTNVIDGTEMESLRRDVERMEPFFKEVRVGQPLLYSVDDALRVADILVNRHPATAKKREHVLFVGHGTGTPATALYSEIDYMLRDAGHANYHVGTIEGYPTFELVLAASAQGGQSQKGDARALYVRGRRPCRQRYIQRVERAARGAGLYCRPAHRGPGRGA